MRIIIEMTEAEGRSMTISRETVAGETAVQPLPPAADGGQPSDALLLALGSEPEAAAERPSGSDGAADAGEPAAWLLEGLAGRNEST